MARSVNYLGNALGVTYFHTAPENFENDLEFSYENEAEFTWDDFVGNITASLQANYGSFDTVKHRWDGRETRIILENNHAEIGISEYCGLASVSIRIRESDYTNYQLAEGWINRAWPGMVKAMEENTYHTHLRKIGTASNGESFYEKIA